MFDRHCLVYVGLVDYKCQVQRRATLFNTFAMTLPSGGLPTWCRAIKAPHDKGQKDSSDWGSGLSHTNLCSYIV